MIKILKAEYSYLMYGSIKSGLVIAGLFFFYRTLEVVIVNRITFMIGLFLIAQLIGTRRTEKRSYNETRLPIKFKTLSSIRLILVALPITILYSIAIALNLSMFGYSTVWNDSVFELISMYLISMLISFVYYFLTDIFSVFQTKKGRIIYEVVIGIIIGIALLFTMVTTEKSYSTSLYFGISINIFAAIGIIFFAFVTRSTFRQKESHIS